MLAIGTVALAATSMQPILVIVFLTQPGWSFIMLPTALGAAVLLLVALTYNNLTRKGRYPKYW